MGSNIGITRIVVSLHCEKACNSDSGKLFLLSAWEHKECHEDHVESNYSLANTCQSDIKSNHAKSLT